MNGGPDTQLLNEPSTPALKLALASASPAMRGVFASLFALDDRLRKAVASVSEPMLGQIRLAWWRDELERTIEAAAADPLLGDLRAAFGKSTTLLAELVDGWEAVLAAESVEARCESFAAGRAGAFALVAKLTDAGAHAAEARRAGRLWAWADLANGLGGQNSAEVAAPINIDSSPLSLPRRLRPIAIIGGLARRSLRNPGTPLLGDRLSPLVALRLGLLGR